MDTGCFHGIDLSLGRAAAAADDRPCMPHSASRWGGQAGDKSDHRLGDLLGDEFRRFFLGGAAEFANRDDTGGSRILLESLKAVDEVGAVYRIPSNPDACRLADSLTGQLMNDFIGEGAGT